MRAVYTVKYRMYGAADEKSISVIASSKADAYDVAAWDLIPEKEGNYPYSAWVSSVTYNNGNCHYFNTSEGNAY